MLYGKCVRVNPYAEHGEPLSLGEAAAMADAMGMTYGQYSLLLSKQKRNAAIK